MPEAMIARSWPRFAARVSLCLDGARVHVSLPPYE
jgi:hypothetical protein